MDLNETVQECLQAICREIGCDACYVSFTVGQSLQSYMLQSGKARDQACFFNVQETLCTVTLDSEQPLMIEDAGDDRRFSDLSVVKSRSVVGYMAVKIRLQDEVVGTICVVSREPRVWRSIELELLKSLARTLEVALNVEMQQLTVERFATSLNDMDNILAILADGLSGPVAIFDAEGVPVFYSESLPNMLSQRCMTRLGQEVVTAYESSVSEARLNPGEKLDLRYSHCDIAVVKASEKFYYCSIPERQMLLH
ncbi:MAG: GAF domain-containing protein [Silicimonas sp.]|nr:GAF domain-containing protein [Silicimonas sp.]